MNRCYGGWLRCRCVVHSTVCAAFAHLCTHLCVFVCLCGPVWACVYADTSPAAWLEQRLDLRGKAAVPAKLEATSLGAQQVGRAVHHRPPGRAAVPVARCHHSHPRRVGGTRRCVGRTCGCGVHAGGLSIASQRVAVAAPRGGVSETRQLAPGEREGCGWHPVLPLQRCSAQGGTYSGRRVIVCGWQWLGVSVAGCGCALCFLMDVGCWASGVGGGKAGGQARRRNFNGLSCRGDTLAWQDNRGVVGGVHSARLACVGVDHD